MFLKNKTKQKKTQWNFSFPDWERDTAVFKSVRLGVQHGKLSTRV